MSTFLDPAFCSDAATPNTGARGQFLEGLTVKFVMATDDQSFLTLADAKSLTVWKQQIADKKLIPIYDAEELAIADTEDTYKELRRIKIKTASGKKVTTFNAFISLCSTAALKAYEGRTVYVYEITENGELIAVSKDGIIITGQRAVFNFGIRKRTVGDNAPYVPTTVNYLDYKELETNPKIVKLDFVPDDAPGVSDVNIEQVSASATQVKFKITDACCGAPIFGFEDADLTFKTALGAAVTHSFVAADVDGVYTFTGTGFLSGHVIDLDGVVIQPTAIYESVAPLTIAVT